jgi:TonB family protein
MHNVKYPREARKKYIQGMVLISFVVEEDGKLVDIKVLKSLGEDIDNEAVKVISQCPAWKPGYVDGKPVRVAYSVPINFTLDNTIHYH